MSVRKPILVALLLGIAVSVAAGAPSVRVKDLTEVEGVRSNPLVGYGLVVGLQGTGDGTQAKFTTQSLANLLKRSGISVPESSVRVRNVAAVMVTASLPPFARPGQRLDVQVSSMGDAKSLQGGTLLMTPILGPDGNTYAVAQGAVSLGGGFSGGGGGNSVTKNHPTVGRVPGGATVERQVQLSMADFETFRLLLNQPDFETARRISHALNLQFGSPIARAEDPGSVLIDPPQGINGDPVGLMARVESVEVRPDIQARVVINERTGTVVMGNDVRVSKVALAHGNLTIELRTDLTASQPAPFSEKGETVVVPQRDVLATEEANKVLTLEDGVSVSELVDALNQLGVSSRDMVAIFQAMHAAGALHAKLEILWIEAASQVAFEAANSSQHKELRKAADAFESLFTQMLVQQMRDAQLEEGLFGQGSGASTYETIFDQFLSQSLSDRSPLGIADMLFRNWTGEGAAVEARDVTAHLSRLRAAEAYESTLGSFSVETHSLEISFGETKAQPAPRISRPFGFGKDPINGEHRFHGGTDLPAPTGTPVLAPAAGRVTKVEEHTGYGLQVLIDHGAEKVTRYAHLSAAEVEVGQWIGAGEILGRVGNSGRSTGPHLHFETHRKGQKIDPTDFIQGPSRAQVLGHAADKSTGTGEDE